MAKSTNTQQGQQRRSFNAEEVPLVMEQQGRDSIGIRLVRYQNGSVYLDVRKFFQPPDQPEGTLVPTKQGASISLENLRRLAKKLDRINVAGLADGSVSFDEVRAKLEGKGGAKSAHKKGSTKAKRPSFR